MKKIIALTLVLVLAAALAVGIGAADRKVIGKYVSEKDNEISWKLYSDGELVIYGDAAIPNFNGAYADWMAYGDAITKVTIEEGVTAIGKCAFYNLILLEEVTIPDTVETIGMQAFYKCIKLKNVTIPGSVEVVGAEAFSGCVNLVNVTFENGVQNIRSAAFSKCKKIKTLTFPKSIESVGAEAFKDCTGIEKVYTSASKAFELGADAFDGVDEDVFTIYYPEGATGYTKGEWVRYYTEDYKLDTDDEEEDEDEADEIKRGDVNGDGSIKLSDLNALNAYIAGAVAKTDINEEAADIDGDGKITVADSVYFARYIDGWKKYKL